MNGAPAEFVARRVQKGTAGVGNHNIHGHSPQDDLIDFACSDTYRDDYAAQGLTYTADGSRPKGRLRIPDWHSELDEAQAENHALKREIRLLRLENAELRRQPSNGHRPSAEEPARRSPSRGFQGVLDQADQSEDLDAPR